MHPVVEQSSTRDVPRQLAASDTGSVRQVLRLRRDLLGEHARLRREFGEVAKVHKLAWMPFGSGVHKCIGMHFAGVEVKAVMHQFLRRLQWSVAPSYKWPLDLTALPVVKDELPLELRIARLR